jgi:hypothetical protein
MQMLKKSTKEDLRLCRTNQIPRVVEDIEQDDRAGVERELNR